MTRKAYQLWHNGWRSSEDCTIALQAAQAMFKRLRVDIAIMPNCSNSISFKSKENLR